MTLEKQKTHSVWLEKSRKLLQDACTPWGIKASLTDKDNYGAVFTRDAVMAGIAGILLGDKIIIDGFKNTLFNLKVLQEAQGQIASNFKVRNAEVASVSFGTLSPKIDSCTWYLIGVGLLLKEGLIDHADYRKSVVQTIALLDGLEYNGKHLVYIPKGGNWADEYIYEGYVIYDQILRVWGLTLLAAEFDNKNWADKALAIRSRIENDYKDEHSKYYNSSFSPGGVFERFDLAAHGLAGIIFEEENGFYDQSLDWIYENFIKRKKFPPAFYPVIEHSDPQWNALRNYHLFDFKNKPHHYHNGGIWWIWVGWLSVSLSLWNKTKSLDKLKKMSFQFLDDLPNFDFEEYISADHLELHGTPKLCYSAAGIIFLCLSEDPINFAKIKL